MPKKGQIEPYPFANIDGKEEKVEGKIDLPDIDLPENLKQTRKKNRKWWSICIWC